MSSRRNSKNQNIQHYNDSYSDGFGTEGRFIDEQIPDDEDFHQHTIPPEANLSTKLRNPNHNYCWWCFGVLILAGVVTLAVILGVVVPEDRNHGDMSEGTTIDDFDNNQNETSAPSSSNNYNINSTTSSSRNDYFYNLVKEWSGETSLQDPNHASSRALNWLLNDDPFQLTENNGRSCVVCLYKMFSWIHSLILSPFFLVCLFVKNQQLPEQLY